MSRDGLQVVGLRLDEPERLRWRRLVLVSVVSLAVGGPVVGLMVREHLAVLAARAAYWSLEGRPCQPLDPARFGAVSHPPTVTPYAGALYLRHAGGMTCTHRTREIGDQPVRYPVCKFTGPDYLGVRFKGQDRFYDLTMGRAAAVGVVGGQVRCVVTGKFEM